MPRRPQGLDPHYRTQPATGLVPAVDRSGIRRPQGLDPYYRTHARTVPLAAAVAVATGGPSVADLWVVEGCAYPQGPSGPAVAPSVAEGRSRGPSAGPSPAAPGLPPWAVVPSVEGAKARRRAALAYATVEAPWAAGAKGPRPSPLCVLLPAALRTMGTVRSLPWVHWLMRLAIHPLQRHIPVGVGQVSATPLVVPRPQGLYPHHRGYQRGPMMLHTLIGHWAAPVAGASHRQRTPAAVPSPPPSEAAVIWVHLCLAPAGGPAATPGPSRRHPRDSLGVVP